MTQTINKCKCCSVSAGCANKLSNLKVVNMSIMCSQLVSTASKWPNSVIAGLKIFSFLSFWLCLALTFTDIHILAHKYTLWINTHLTIVGSSNLMYLRYPPHNPLKIIHFQEAFLSSHREWWVVVRPFSDTNLTHPGNVWALSKLCLPPCTNEWWPQHVIPPG